MSQWTTKWTRFLETEAPFGDLMHIPPVRRVIFLSRDYPLGVDSELLGVSNQSKVAQ